MRRMLIVSLGLLLASPVLAQSQADDDEKPGSRTSGNTTTSTSKQPADTPLDVTPTQPGDPSTSPNRAPGNPPSPPALNGSGPAADGARLRRDGNLNLDDRGASRREGVYEGVTLGGEHLPPRPPKLPLKGSQKMTWPGFQVRDGIPTVFLQTTGTPDYTVVESPGALVVTLRATTINLRNNMRPLKVAEFGTNVTEVSAKPRGKDVVVTIARQKSGTHRERVEPSTGGYQVLVVELPPQ